MKKTLHRNGRWSAGRFGYILTGITLLILVFTSQLTALAQQPGQYDKLDSIVNTALKTWKAPGAAVAVVNGQSMAYAKGFGVRDVRNGKPVTADTLFDIGSCTKAFTSAAIAMLVDQGKMDWDGKVNRYIPFFHLYDSMADENVTMRDLLTHRTGVPGTDMIWYGTPYSREEIIRRMVYAKPNTGFRTLFQYQNVMYLTAGYAVGQVAGGTWDDYVRDHIFAPLGMTESDTSAVDAQKAPDFAAPHAQKGDGSVIAIPWRNIDNAGPAGSINSSVRDMSKWIAMQMNGGMFEGKQIISAKNIEEMHSPQVVVPEGGEISNVFFPESTQLSYGLGWFIDDYRGHKLIVHPGDIDGFSALVVLIPEIKTGYVVLVNMGGFCRQVIGYSVADALLNLPPIDWTERFQNLQKEMRKESAEARSWKSHRKEGTHPTLALDDYAGNYINHLYGDATVSVENGKLMFAFHGMKAPMEHFQYDTFIVSLEGQSRLTFNLDENGKVKDFTVADMEFTRDEKKGGEEASGR